jgi:16S rRNA (cytidine1402-2'-O)-methyltransferase
MLAGSIFLLSTYLGDDAREDSLSMWELSLVQDLKMYFTENEKSARRFLRKAGYKGSLDEIILHRFDKDTRIDEQNKLLSLVKQGNHVGLISEAGAPALADPGANLLGLAHEQGISIIPVPGPSAIMLSIISSGLNGQQFTFHGYLPIDKVARSKKLREIEQVSLQTGYAQFFIETPYRNAAIIDECINTLSPQTKLCIAANLTVPDGWVKTKTIEKWKLQKPEIQKIPAVFGLLKSA